MTRSWFFAAARSIAGPPTSMFSMASASVQSGREVVGLERIEIHDEHVDEVDAVRASRRVVDAAAREQAAVDPRMQRLHAAIHDLGEFGNRSDVDDR